MLAAYLSELAKPGDDRPPAAVATIERRLSAIAQAHRVAGLGSPRRDPLVAETLRGVRRLLGVAPHARKAGALTADIKAAVTAMNLDTRAGVRDRALLLVGFAAGMRRSELVGLDVEDLEAAPVLAGDVINGGRDLKQSVPRPPGSCAECRRCSALGRPHRRPSHRRLKNR